MFDRSRLTRDHKIEMMMMMMMMIIFGHSVYIHALHGITLHSAGSLPPLLCISVSYSSSLSRSISNGFVIGWNSTPSSASLLNRFAVAVLDRFTLKTLMRWQEDVTWRSQFHVLLTYVGCVFKALSQHLATSSSLAPFPCQHFISISHI